MSNDIKVQVSYTKLEEVSMFLSPALTGGTKGLKGKAFAGKIFSNLKEIFAAYKMRLATLFSLKVWVNNHFVMKKLTQKIAYIKNETDRASEDISKNRENKADLGVAFTGVKEMQQVRKLLSKSGADSKFLNIIKLNLRDLETSIIELASKIEFQKRAGQTLPVLKQREIAFTEGKQMSEFFATTIMILTHLFHEAQQQQQQNEGDGASVEELPEVPTVIVEETPVLVPPESDPIANPRKLNKEEMMQKAEEQFTYHPKKEKILNAIEQHLGRRSVDLRKRMSQHLTEDERQEYCAIQECLNAFFDREEIYKSIEVSPFGGRLVNVDKWRAQVIKRAEEFVSKMSGESEQSQVTDKMRLDVLNYIRNMAYTTEFTEDTGACIKKWELEHGPDFQFPYNKVHQFFRANFY